MTLEEMDETKKEERIMSVCAVHANKVPKELMEALAGQFKGR